MIKQLFKTFYAIFIVIILYFMIFLALPFWAGFTWQLIKLGFKTGLEMF